jgi:hypothetical protein
MTPPEAAPYEQLARSLERELELLGFGRLDELDALHAERAAVLATLPPTPPASARSALQRAQLTLKRVEIEIIRRREAIVLDLAQLERVRRTARGYTPPSANRPRFCANA